EQIARTRAWRAAHDGPAKAEALGRIDAAARGDHNLMPLILAAVKAEATLGEISDALRDVFGEYRESVVL
ncbi:MAG: methylmalonyl-CoA mutase family protein, partial [Anaeromyxobacteraceae bacterium]